MPMSHRVLALFGGAAAALLTSFIAPTALGHAEGADAGTWQTCDGDVCLVMGDAAEDDWSYSGVRPFFTDWIGHQPYTVEVTQDDGSVIDAGSYNIDIQDYWSPIFAISMYHYGDFVPNDAAPSGLDLGDFGDLSDAWVYDSRLFDGAIDQVILQNVHQNGHDINYIILSMGDFTNTFAYTWSATADYIQVGDSDPTFLWNSLFHSGFPKVPDYFVPADPFADLDFDPGDFEWGDIAGM
jgi:hypothetical protein